jgi:hypothetical protein
MKRLAYFFGAFFLTLLLFLAPFAKGTFTTVAVKQ